MPCSTSLPDCDGNRDCYGPLECFQRKGYVTIWFHIRKEYVSLSHQSILFPFHSGETVPGCPGSAKGEVDYCFLPEGVSLPTLAPIVSVMEDFSVIEEETTSQNSGLEIRNVECSEDSPCLQCQGGRF